MARVYLGTDLKHERPVAIKVLRTELATDDGRSRFSQEISVVAGLRHPHILPLLDSGEVEGYPFLVMPYVEGETLADRLDREGKLSIADTIAILTEVADGTSAAHRAGLVHRDIKPENVMLSDGHAILADFGVAHIIRDQPGDRLSSSGMLLGTPLYMSPEQAGGDLMLDHRSDVYSLACVAYHMLGGDPPFTGRQLSSVIAKHLTAPAPDLRVVRADVPEGVARAVRRAMSKAPADRFDSATDFLDALREGVDEARQPLRPTGTSRSTMALLAATVITVLSIGIAGTRSRGPSAMEGTQTILVTGYQPAASTAGSRAALDQAEDELARLLTGWDQVSAMPAATRAEARRQLESADEDVVENALRFARGADATTLVFLERTERDGRAFLSARIHDTESGEMTDAPIVTDAPAGDVFGLVAPVALRALGLGGAPSELRTLQRESRNLAALTLQREGRRNLDQRNLSVAEPLLRQAVEQDSSFARAKYELATALHWRGVQNRSEHPDLLGEIRRLLTEARRGASAMGVRDSTEVEGFFALMNGAYEDARSTAEALLEADPGDHQAWLLLGSVEYWDPWTVDAGNGTFVPRGSLNRATDAFRRSVQLAPDFFLGYGQLFDIFQRMSGAIVRNTCYRYELPSESVLLILERRPETTGVNWCPVMRDSIVMVSRPELEAIDDRALVEGAERLLNAVDVELRRSAELVPESPWPHAALADWAVAKTSLRIETGTSQSWAELMADALPEAEAALVLTTNPSPLDLVRVAGFRLAVGQSEAATIATRRAIEIAGAAGPEGVASLPPSTPDAFLATGRLQDALDVWAYPSVDFRLNGIDLLVAPLANRLEVFGALGYTGPEVAETFSEIERIWTDAGYSASDRLPLRRYLTRSVLLALVGDPVGRRRWFEGWEPDDPLVRGWLELEGSEEAAREALSTVLELYSDGFPNRRDTYLVGVLAIRLGQHQSALATFDHIDRHRVNPDRLSPSWALLTRSFLQRGRTFEALNDPEAAIAAYQGFVDRWEGSDPVLHDELDEARAAIVRLQAS